MCRSHRWEENWKGQLYCEKCGILKSELHRYGKDKRVQREVKVKEVDLDEVLDFLVGDLGELHAWTSPSTVRNVKNQKDRGIRIEFS